MGCGAELGRAATVAGGAGRVNPPVADPRAVTSPRRWGWRALYLAAVAAFLLAFARFHDPGFGFTRLISVGDRVAPAAVPMLRATPHYVHEDSYGYDGTYYAQIALHPLLREPALDLALDNPHYRARRVAVPWLAWLAGLGQPGWILQAYAVANAVCWLGFAWILLAWFPADGWQNFLRWAGFLFSAGVCLSVRHALLDGPALLLTALAVRAVECGWPRRGVAWLALAALTKETSVLSSAVLVAPWPRDWRGWAGLVVKGAWVVAPLGVWMLYVSARFGPVADAGDGNFSWPLTGLVEKARELGGDLVANGVRAPEVLGLAALLGTVVQFLFLALWWQPAMAWWRAAAPFAVLLMFVSQPVWEGFPGAYPRVLLPLALAFNVLVPRGGRWLPLLLAGNLAVPLGLTQLAAPPGEFFRVDTTAVRVVRGEGWYPAETGDGRTWRWTGAVGTLRVENPGDRPVALRLRGEARGMGEGEMVLRVAGEERWRGPLGVKREPFATSSLQVPAAASVVWEFAATIPPRAPGKGDDRDLALALYDVVIEPVASGGRP